MKRGMALVAITIGATLLFGFRRVTAEEQHWPSLLAASIALGTVAALIDAVFGSAGDRRVRFVAEIIMLIVILVVPVSAMGGVRFAWLAVPIAAGVTSLHWIRDLAAARSDGQRGEGGRGGRGVPR